MAVRTIFRHPAVEETFMRFASIAIAFSMIYAVSSSVGQAQDPEPSPRAAMLIAQGDAALASGEAQRAIDFYEAALVVDPAYTPLFNDLGDAARRDNLQGKAITYYRETLRRDPENFAALAGEGSALAEKGALGKAREKLAQLEELCGSNCQETQTLTAAIATGPKPQVLRAEAVMSEPQVEQN
ncbi:MAG: tetratricopeptide repeat protein [Pontixanthobacter sp.]